MRVCGALHVWPVSHQTKWSFVCRWMQRACCQSADKVRNPLSALTQCCTFENIAYNGDYLVMLARSLARKLVRALEGPGLCIDAVHERGKLIN